MRTRLVWAGLSLSVVMFGVAVDRSLADPGDHPNAEACTGIVIATLAQEGITLQEVHLAFVKQACAAGESPEAVVQKVREATP
jgi:hypothetical protein